MARIVIVVVIAGLGCAQAPTPGPPAAPSAPTATASASRTPARPADSPARLTARPSGAVTEGLSPGLQPLGAAGGRDGWIYVPDGVTEPAPLLVTLHGAGGEARRSIRPFVEHADAEDVVLLAVDSRGATWDIVTGAFGPDVEFVDRALQRVFDRITVDPDRIAITGYSDGASYALSLGLSNGQLFDAVVAFSPGSALHENSPQQPRVFVAHGTSDRVLPIDRTSRRVVPRLEDQGYDVRYEEFDGGHEVPERIREAAMDWLLGGW